jgi:arylsulfatase A-like enzyme
MPMLQNLKICTAGTVLLTLFFSGITNHTAVPPKEIPPNIIIILVDDAGYADFGFMGCKDLQTPNLDKLASQSIKFTDAHVTASVCSPSRAGLLTGKYQQRFGYECNEGEGYPGMDTSQLLLPKILQENGYSTAAIGKWHLGYEASQHPLKRGFQYYYGFLSGGRSYFYQPDKDDKKGSKNALIENYQQVSFDGYLTDVLAQKAVSYIRDNKKNPFFIYWAPNAVHTPMEASKEDMEKFADHPRKKLAAMTYSLDRAVGNIIAELKQQGIFDNTLIFFLSDNGGAHNNQSSNLPLKGFKGNKYEAGHRVPFLVSWPKSLKGNTVFNGLTSSLDIFATALEAAGVSNRSALGLDGKSLIPYLKNKSNQQPHQLLVWRKDKAAAIRSGKYKLIQIQGAGERLYDLSKDPGEKNDLISKKPAIYAKLKRKFDLWQKDKMQPIWTEGATWDTITLMIHDDLMQNRKVRVRNPEELKEFQLKK